ncbi:MAG TPA: serine/threonine-protein kinase [Anaerolineaceae bacterium]
MSFVVGATVGSYRIIEQLGHGGMATVYKAYHSALDRYVAIKVLHPAFLEDKTFLARFEREARVVARLEHPNIVPIYDFAEHEGRPYLVLKYIEGETLKAYMRTHVLDMDEIIHIIEPIGSALAYAHKQNVLHRDVKPSNVLMAKDGMIYLTDFGLARMAQGSTSTLTSDMLVGTPQYISPEQAMSRPNLDQRTDIYSFGIMIYEMVCGRVPFNADTPFATIHDHLYTPLPLPRSVRPDIPEGVERVLVKSLAKSPDDRYASVQELVSALRTAISGGDIPPVILTGAGSTLINSDEPSPRVTPMDNNPPGGLKDGIATVREENVLPTVLDVPQKQDAFRNSHVSQEAMADSQPIKSTVIEPLSVSSPLESIQSEGQSRNVEVQIPRTPPQPASTAVQPVHPAGESAVPAKSSAVSKTIPEKKFNLLWIIIPGGIVLLTAVILVSLFVIRSVRQQANIQEPPPAVKPNGQSSSANPAARQALERAVDAWQKRHLAEVEMYVGESLKLAGKDLVFFREAIDYLNAQNAQLVATIFVVGINDRYAMLENGLYAGLVRLRAYKLADSDDPLAGEYLLRKQEDQGLLVARVRYLVIHRSPEESQPDLQALLSRDVFWTRYPEIRLVEAEYYIKKGNPDRAKEVIADLLTLKNLPEWVKTEAIAIQKRIP